MASAYFATESQARSNGVSSTDAIMSFGIIKIKILNTVPLRLNRITNAILSVRKQPGGP